MDATPGNVQKPSGIRIKTVQLREAQEERHYISYPLSGCDPNLAQMACKWLSLPGTCKWLLLPETHWPVKKNQFSSQSGCWYRRGGGGWPCSGTIDASLTVVRPMQGEAKPSAPYLNPPLAHCKAGDNEVSLPALQLISLEPCPISI